MPFDDRMWLNGSGLPQFLSGRTSSLVGSSHNQPEPGTSSQTAKLRHRIGRTTQLYNTTPARSEYLLLFIQTCKNFLIPNTHTLIRSNCTSTCAIYHEQPHNTHILTNPYTTVTMASKQFMRATRTVRAPIRTNARQIRFQSSGPNVSEGTKQAAANSSQGLVGGLAGGALVFAVSYSSSKLSRI
jgi:hypothetical protein